MGDIRDFRNIADEVMCDINVTDEMKNEVLNRCREKRKAHIPALKLAAVAACGVLVIGVLHFTGALKPILPDDQDKISENEQPGIFSAQDNQEKAPGQSDISIMNEPFAAGEWQPDSLEEAGRSFGEGFLTPSHIPEGYRQIGIYASGPDSGRADKIIINYSADERFFAIIQQKTEESGEFSDFEAVDINGSNGYIMSDNAGTVSYTQLYWSDDGIMYTISGALAKEEALRTARSMKPAAQE